MLKYENNTITRCQFGRRKSPPILAEKSLAKLEILQLVFFLTRAVKPFKITLTAWICFLSIIMCTLKAIVESSMR